MTNPANQVLLTGRVSQGARQREMPSGDIAVTFRIVVPRRRRRISKQTVDVFDCTAWTSVARRSALRLTVDDEVHVEGQIRRSFRRAGGAPVSFVGIDVDRCKRAS